MIKKILERLDEEIQDMIENVPDGDFLRGNVNFSNVAKEAIQEVANEHNNGWIPVTERLPKCEDEYGWVNCIVSVIRMHYPTSTYDICDSPYDENLVMHAQFNAFQKIWHLECDEQLNALIDIEDAPLNGDYVVAWQPLPPAYQKGE